MTTGVSALVAAHVIFTTLGYSALVVANVSVALSAREREPQSWTDALRTAVRISRIFGPLLGIGILLGIAALFATHLPAFSPWLVATYALIVMALVLQAAVALPWYGRSLQAATPGAPRDIAPDRRAPAVFAIAFAAAFAIIVALMVMKPY